MQIPEHHNVVYIYASSLNPSPLQFVLIVLLHNLPSSVGKQCFVVLRQQQFTVQGILNVNETISKAMIKFVSG